MLSNEPVVISRLRRATRRSSCARFLVLFLRGFAYLLGTFVFGFLQRGLRIGLSRNESFDVLLI